MLKHLPNLLTGFRIILIPFFAIFMIRQTPDHSIAIALAIFIIAALTDYFDGAIARKYNVISDFGKIADPLADKLLVLTALACLTWLPPFNLHVMIFIIILSREVVITILREIYKRRNIIIPADKLGKVKTLMQMLGIIAALALWAFMSEVTKPMLALISIWFWMVALITLISGLNYIIIRKGKRGT